MIKRLSVFDTDEFVDIVNESFSKELQYIGGEFGSSKFYMKISYAGMRMLQKIMGDVRDVPDIFGYYHEGKVMGITKMIPINARKDHWYTEMTAVKKDFQQKGVGTALKKHTLTYYTGKARRFFGTLREKNVPSLKANTRVGYEPYVKKILFKKMPPTHCDGTVKGFRQFDHDQKGVFELYTRTTPSDIVKIEDKVSQDFQRGMVMKLLTWLHTLQGGVDKRYIIERNGKICGYFNFEQLWGNYENMEMMLDLQYDDLKNKIQDIIGLVSPQKQIVSYVPEYRTFEEECLRNAGFEKKEPYLGIVRIFKR